MKEINIKIKIKILKNGQTQKYGDLNYEYEIEVRGMSEYDVKIYCTKILNKCNQTKDEWDKNDLNSYFNGYYEFEKIEGSGYGVNEQGKYRYYVYIPSTH